MTAHLSVIEKNPLVVIARSPEYFRDDEAISAIALNNEIIALPLVARNDRISGRRLQPTLIGSTHRPSDLLSYVLHYKSTQARKGEVGAVTSPDGRD